VGGEHTHRSTRGNKKPNDTRIDACQCACGVAWRSRSRRAGFRAGWRARARAAEFQCADEPDPEGRMRMLVRWLWLLVVTARIRATSTSGSSAPLDLPLPLQSRRWVGGGPGRELWDGKRSPQ